MNRTLRWFRAKGMRVKCVMTDDRRGYVSRLFAKACRVLGIRHIRIRTYTPKTNGKVGHFIQTLLREWAYALPYHSPHGRIADLQRRRRHNTLMVTLNIDREPAGSSRPSEYRRGDPRPGVPNGGLWLSAANLMRDRTCPFPRAGQPCAPAGCCYSILRKRPGFPRSRVSCGQAGLGR